MAELAKLNDTSLKDVADQIRAATTKLTSTTLFADIDHVGQLKDALPSLNKLDESITSIKGSVDANVQRLLGEIQIQVKSIEKLMDYEQMLKNKVAASNSTSGMMNALHVTPGEAKQVHLEKKLAEEVKSPITDKKSVKDRAAAFEQLGQQQTAKPEDPEPTPKSPRMR